MSEESLEKSSLKNCPFFNKSLPSVSALSSISFPETNHVAFFIDELPIQDVIFSIAFGGGVAQRKGFSKKLLEKAIKICEDNWILQWRHLKQLPLPRLRMLGLPLYLESEMAKAVEFYKEQINIHGAMSREDLEQHAKHLSLINATDITEEQKGFVTKSWMSLLNKNVEDPTLRNRISESFYNRFFEASPVGKRLFETRTLEEQAKTLFKIIGYIVTNLEDVGQLNRYIKRLGGRHALYGVTENDFIPFVEEWKGTLYDILGKKVMNADTQDAWDGVMKYCARTMIEAGKSYDEGTCLSCFTTNEGENKLKEIFLKITLDRMYICLDDTYTKFKKQLTLRGLNSIRIVEIEDAHCFQLSSINPPFSIILGATAEREMKKLIKHFAWRIKALQRVHTEDSNSSHDSNSSSIGGIEKLNDQIKANQEDSSSELSNILSNVEILQRSWRMIVGDHGTLENNDKASKFFDVLFQRLIQLSPAAEHLFGSASIIHHIPALTKMISLIIRERGDIVKDVLMRTGAKHCIWGIKVHDIQCFGTAICDAFQRVLGDIISQNVRDAWFYSIMGLGKEMLKLGRKVDSEHAFSCPAVKRGRYGWSSHTLLLTLNDCHIYKGNSLKKLKNSINIKSIEAVEREESGLIELATDYCLYLVREDETLYFCFSDRQSMRKFQTEMAWRLEASERTIVAL